MRERRNEALDPILSRFKRVRRDGNRWIAACPVPGTEPHDLYISTDDGRHRIKCSNGCITTEILEAVELNYGDLLTTSPSDAGSAAEAAVQQSTTPRYNPVALQEDDEGLQSEPMQASMDVVEQGHGTDPVHGGEPSSEGQTNKEAAFDPDHALYLCQEVEDAKTLRVVFPESHIFTEEQVDALVETLLDADAEPPIIIVHRSTGEGMHFVAVQGAKLSSVTTNIRCCPTASLPGMNAPLTAAPFGPPQALVRSRVASAEQFTPPPSTYAQVVAKLETAWLWDKYIPRGYLTLLAGNSGVGKSILIMNGIIRTITTGAPFPDGSAYSEPLGNVILCDTESSQHLNKQHAIECGIPPECLITPFADPLEEFQITNPEHRRALEDAMRDERVRLVVIDSLSGGFTGDENSSSMVQVLKPLALLARDTGVPIILTHHLNKDSFETKNNPVTMDRIRGATAILQVTRHVIGIYAPKSPGPYVRGLTIVKTNLGVTAAPLKYTMEDHRLLPWSDPESANGAAAMQDDDGPVPKGVSKPDGKKAEQFLLNVLTDGSKHPVADIVKEAEKLGISEGQLNRAKKALNVPSRKEGKVWVWSLPSSSSPEEVKD